MRKISLQSFVIFLLAIAGANSSVSDLNQLVRQSTNQILSQVKVARNSVSGSQYEAFNFAVTIVEGYWRYVLDTAKEITSLADEECLQTLPKPVYSILRTADWHMGMCVGHMAVYGGQMVHDAEAEVRRFEDPINLLSIQSTKEFFLSDNWADAEGAQAAIDSLTRRMQNWDNVESVHLYDFKLGTQQDMSQISHEWALCGNHQHMEMQKMFDQARQHIEKECKGNN